MRRSAYSCHRIPILSSLAGCRFPGRAKNECQARTLIFFCPKVAFTFCGTRTRVRRRRHHPSPSHRRRAARRTLLASVHRPAAETCPGVTSGFYTSYLVIFFFHAKCHRVPLHRRFMCLSNVGFPIFPILLFRFSIVVYALKAPCFVHICLHTLLRYFIFLK